MSTSLLDAFPFMADLWQAIAGSALFFILKWFLILYSLVIIANIVMLLMARGLKSDIKASVFGNERPLITKSALQKRWDEIKKRLASGNASQYKVAVLEADHMADELLAEIGYAGANMAERLQNVHLGQLESFENLKRAHEIRNRIVNEKDFQMTQGEADEILENYRVFFEELELF